MIVCAPVSGASNAACPKGYAPIYAGTEATGFQPLVLQESPECSGFFCDMVVQDVGFAGFVVVAFSLGFAAGFMRR